MWAIMPFSAFRLRLFSYSCAVIVRLVSAYLTNSIINCRDLFVFSLVYAVVIGLAQFL